MIFFGTVNDVSPKKEFENAITKFDRLVVYRSHVGWLHQDNKPDFLAFLIILIIRKRYYVGCFFE